MSDHDEFDPDQLFFHPGEILRFHFLEPLGLPYQDFANDLSESPDTLREVIECTRDVTPILAMKFATYFRNKPSFWMRMQDHYNRAKLLQDPKIQEMLSRVPRRFHIQLGKKFMLPED